MAASTGLLEVKIRFSDCYNFLILHPILTGFVTGCMVKYDLSVTKRIWARVLTSIKTVESKGSRLRIKSDEKHLFSLYKKVHTLM